jgi:pyruvate dehydrogenase E2 component (dihydrolipoamide acetyltransferase)
MEKQIEEMTKDRKARIRRAMGVVMSRAKREIPHYYLAHAVDMTRALTWLEEENRKRSMEDRLIYAVLLVKAVALASREVPEMNGFWRENEFEPAPEVHVGMGISLKKGGLIAPALLDADKKSLGELMEALRDLTERARSGGLRGAEMSGATITITNLGELGVDQVFGVIYPPQVALVGFGRISPAKTITCTISADHRASDGYRGSLFLTAIDRILQEPGGL